MAQYNTIDQRKNYGKPPIHYKLVGRDINKSNLDPPNLDLLTSGDRDNSLNFLLGASNQPIPLKWKNPFSYGFENLFRKYNEELLKSHDIDVNPRLLLLLNDSIYSYQG